MKERTYSVALIKFNDKYLCQATENMVTMNKHLREQRTVLGYEILGVYHKVTDLYRFDTAVHDLNAGKDVDLEKLIES
jgi:hypothetical protein